MSVPLPLSSRPRFGAMVSAFDGSHVRRIAASVSKWGYHALWAGDHIAFTGPISDPLTQIAFFSALAPELVFGTCVYLLPLRHPTVVAKQVATLDRLLGAGHFIFGVGVGGEFAREYEACGVPVKERGGRASEAIVVMKRLWTERRVAHQGKYFSFDEVAMEPKPLSPGGPPVLVGGRAEAALRRAAIAGDGWMPYVVAPDRYRKGLESIAAQSEKAGRRFTSFGTGLLLFCTLAQSYERALDVAADQLSKRYAMDFREPAKRYCALGRPSDVATKVNDFVKAGVREFAINAISSAEEQDSQLERFAREVIPLIGNTG